MHLNEFPDVSNPFVPKSQPVATTSNLTVNGEVFSTLSAEAELYHLNSFLTDLCSPPDIDIDSIRSDLSKTETQKKSLKQVISTLEASLETEIAAVNSVRSRVKEFQQEFNVVKHATSIEELENISHSFTSAPLERPWFEQIVDVENVD
ncbi:hypothetical protein P9112_002820 [Eukaryota sp. TZLM1-RC]